MTRNIKLLQEAAREGFWAPMQRVQDRAVIRALSDDVDRDLFSSRAYASHAWKDRRDRLHIVLMHHGKTMLASLWTSDIRRIYEFPSFRIHDLNPDPTATDAAILKCVELGAPNWWEDVVHLRQRERDDSAGEMFDERDRGCDDSDGS